MKSVLFLLLFFRLAAFGQMPKAEFEAAVVTLFGNDQQKAIATLEAAEKKYPNTDKALYLRAIYQFRDGDNNAAMMSQSNAIKANPKFAAAYDGRAELFFNKGMYDKAIADESRAIELEPTNLTYLLSRIRFYHANKQYTEALSDTKTRIQLDPTAYYAYYDAADFSKKIDPNANVDVYFAQSYAVKGIPKFRTDITSGQFMLFQGKFDEARQKYEAALAVAEDQFGAEDLHNAAIVFYKTKFYDKAILYFNKALSFSPENVDYLNNLNSVYNTQQNSEMLKTIAQRTLEINPNDAWANKYMAIGLANTGQEALANEYNEKALRLAAEQTK